MVEAGGAAGQIVVAEMGNKRRNISDEDIAQCVKDLATWMETNAADFYQSKMVPVANAASEDQVTAVLGNFNAAGCSHLKISLQKFNGGLHYQDNFIGLNLDEIT